MAMVRCGTRSLAPGGRHENQMADGTALGQILGG